jgi:arginyl-tRNA synthetase
MTSTTLAGRIDSALAAAFSSLSLPLEFAKSVPSARPDLADRQCNAAIGLGRMAGRNPMNVGEEIAVALSACAEFSEVSVAKPGFVNMRLSDDFIARMTEAQAAFPSLGIEQAATPQRILIDFGGPNVAKPLHVGHLRSLVIGEALRRILAASAHHVVSDVHIGDWGLQMGMLISELELRQPKLPYFKAAFEGPYPDTPPVTLTDLEKMYPDAAAACKAGTKRMEAARKATADLQSGRPGYRALWAHFRSLSLSAQRRDFAELGAHFDLFEGESDAQPLIAPLIADLKARGLAKLSEGAIIIEVAAEGSNETMPPLLLEKADGAALYATTDLATIFDRITRLRAERILYVVDQRQKLHFEQLFRAAKLAGLADSCRLEHAGFGTVNGTDGKPFKTRDGGVMQLSALLAEATGKATQRLESSGHVAGFTLEEKAMLARKVGIAAVKFADLSSLRTTGYVFDADRLVSFEGKTGPYLQYSCVRISSILALAADRGLKPGQIWLSVSTERELALECLGFPDAVAASARTLQPQEIAEYAFGLAKKFSRFYDECPVLAETGANEQASRLALCSAAHAVLSRALWLLGIDVPERM